MRTGRNFLGKVLLTLRTARSNRVLRPSSLHSHSDQEGLITVRSRYKRQLIRLNMKKKWPARAGKEDSRPIFFCKRFSYNENALYLISADTMLSWVAAGSVFVLMPPLTSCPCCSCRPLFHPRNRNFQLFFFARTLRSYVFLTTVARTGVESASLTAFSTCVWTLVFYLPLCLRVGGV